MSTNENNKAPHILNASSNLVGFSFVLFTAVKAFGLSGATLIDDIAAIEVVLFCMSSLFSFMSLRTVSVQKSNFYENVADIIFFIGLGILSLAAIFIMLTIIK